VTDRSPSLPFTLSAPFEPSGDQPQAIRALVEGVQAGLRDQVLMGVTGSGKTFTMAHVIHTLQRPALVLAPNKTLAAQLYGEMKNFFPHNAVEYFVSYYDYYQPEAYIAHRDLYIEKEATINEAIDRMRHAATQAVLERRDVIVVASVSCIYGIGSPETYGRMTLDLARGQHMDQRELIKTLVTLQYKRNDMAPSRGMFRVRGDVIDLFPAHYEDRAWRITLFGDEVENLAGFDALNGEKTEDLEKIRVYANSHYVTPGPTLHQAVQKIRGELKTRLQELLAENKDVEAKRLEQRVTFDLEMIQATGSCQGIENYSRYLTGRQPGEPPPTLFEYLPPDTLLFVDESHVTLPQLGGMYRGDAARKQNLADYGFRLPSCRDNRPMTFEEWEAMRPLTLCVSATPGPWELRQTRGRVVEQVIRPTGLLDPVCEVRPTRHQVDDLISECQRCIRQGGRILVTTLTKKMAEALTTFLNEAGMKVRYIHSDVDTLERIEHIQDLRRGDFDILVGINLLREGLDIPECSLVAILDADKEGFLRSKTALVQTIGRAARHQEGKVILYADRITESMRYALDETQRRRDRQQAWNTAHGIQPRTVRREVGDMLPTTPAPSGRSSSPAGLAVAEEQAAFRIPLLPEERKKLKRELEKTMRECAARLEFEEAARLRDQITRLESEIFA
jgi:excinuclease ABC subunit B